MICDLKQHERKTEVVRSLLARLLGLQGMTLPIQICNEHLEKRRPNHVQGIPKI